MTELLEIIKMFFYGMLIGSVYFMGLAYTVSYIQRRGKSVPILLISFILRSATALFLIFILSGGKAHLILIELIGFLAGRILTVVLLKSKRFDLQKRGLRWR